MSERFERQIEFLLEIDALKSIDRRSYLLNGRRHENSAEHSWHVALLAMVLAEHSAESADVSRAVGMMLVHDLVEIDAGDTFIYDAEGNADKAFRERRAADRVFALLPVDQAAEFRALWEEYEWGDSATARLARAVDRLMPLMHNVHTRGRSWREHGVRRAQVEAVNRPVLEAAGPEFWAYAKQLLDLAVERGYLDA